MKLVSREQLFLVCLYSSALINGILGGVVINDGGVRLVGEQCPGTVDLVCEGVDLTFLQWRYTANNISSEPLVTYTSTNMVNRVMPLSRFPAAFVSTELVSVSVNTNDSSLANFNSILTVNLSQLNSNITEIICGDSVNIIVERVDIMIIEESVPEPPVITSISAMYQNSRLEAVEIFWKKVSTQCPSFESSSFYEVTLSDTDDVSVRVTQDNCTDDCSTMFVPPTESNSSLVVVNLSAVNSIGTNYSTFSLESQASSYLNLTVSFMDCITSVQCSPLVGSNCSVQYTAASDSGSGGQSVPESNLILLPPDTAYTFTATSTLLASNYTLRVTRRMAFTTGLFNPQLSTSNKTQIGVGVVLTVLSVLFPFMMAILIIGFALRLCCKKPVCDCRQPKPILCSIAILLLLFILCIALWIAVAWIVGLQTDTCDLDWQQTRDAVIATALAVSCLMFVAGITVIVVTCRYCCKAPNLEEPRRRNKQGVRSNAATNGNDQRCPSSNDEHTPTNTEQVQQPVTWTQWGKNWISWALSFWQATDEDQGQTPAAPRNLNEQVDSCTSQIATTSAQTNTKLKEEAL